MPLMWECPRCRRKNRQKVIAPKKCLWCNYDERVNYGHEEKVYQSHTLAPSQEI